MPNADDSLYFAGTAAYDQPDVPGWFQSGKDFEAESAQTFGEAFRSLITADTSDVAWQVPDSVMDDGTSVDELDANTPDGLAFFEDSDGGVWATTTSHNAVFSPELLVETLTGEAVNPLLNIPTDSYGLVNPYDFYRPLEDAMEDAEMGQHAFGQFRLYDRGSEVHGDIWFDTKEIDLPAGEGKFKFGIQTGYDFKGNRALYANIIAQDTSCSNTLRQLASKKTRRHVSGEDEWTINSAAYEDWWADILEQIDMVADEMNHVLLDAQDITIEFDVGPELFGEDEEDVLEERPDDAPLPLPFSLDEFYRLAGAGHVGQAIPQYLRDAAAKDTRQRSGDETTHSMWHIHSGLTYALTHVYRGGERGSLLQYNRVAKDLLYNPHEVLAKVDSQYRMELEDEEDEEIAEVGEKGIATVQHASESLESMRDQFDRRQDRIEGILQDEQEA